MHAITAAILAIASIIAAVAVVSATLPEASRSSGILTTQNRSAVERLRSDMDIVYLTGVTSTTQVVFWANNTGTATLADLEAADLLLDTPTGTRRLPYGSGTEYWDYVFEDGELTWTPSTTVKVTATLTSLPAGFYLVKFSLPSGVYGDGDFSV